MNNPPCFNCTKRQRLCHDDCPEYKAWKHEHNAIEDAKRTERQIKWTDYKWRRKHG